MHQSPDQYRQQKRMITAQMMLMEGVSVQSAAKALGYSDAYAFSKQFKRFFGCPPSSCLGRLPSVSENENGVWFCLRTNSIYLVLFTRRESGCDESLIHKKHRLKACAFASFIQKCRNYALVTLPERRQRVQAWTRQGLPSTIAFTFITLGFQVLLVRLWEWDTLIPKATSLPQKSHFAIFCTSFDFHITILF